MKDFILKLVKDFNEYSELVALNYSKMKEGNLNLYTISSTCILSQFPTLNLSTNGLNFLMTNKFFKLVEIEC